MIILEIFWFSPSPFCLRDGARKSDWKLIFRLYIARPWKGGRENEQAKRRRHKHRQTVRIAKTLRWALYLICFWSLCISAPETHLGQLVQIAHFTFYFAIWIQSWRARDSMREAHTSHMSLCVFMCVNNALISRLWISTHFVAARWIRTHLQYALYILVYLYCTLYSK